MKMGTLLNVKDVSYGETHTYDIAVTEVNGTLNTEIIIGTFIGDELDYYEITRGLTNWDGSFNDTGSGRMIYQVFNFTGDITPSDVSNMENQLADVTGKKGIIQKIKDLIFNVK